MFIEKVFIFIIFLGPLVFFHELGHFLFARLFGVRVETFSIGFGPKLFKFKRGDTEYAFSLIPLGGYVKMFGDDPLSNEELSEADKKVAYTHKSKWARFWIVFGGPLANFILAFVIYFCLVMIGEKVPQTKFGVVKSESILFEKGVRTGDLLLKVNEQEITSFDDLNLIDSKVNTIEVLRANEKKSVVLNQTNMEFITEYSKVNSPLRAPLFKNKEGQNILIQFGSTSNFLSMEELIELNPKKFFISIINEEIPVEFRPEAIDGKKLKPEVIEFDEGLKSYLKENSLYSKDLSISNVIEDSAASKAGLKIGDIITSVGGDKISSFDDLRVKIQDLKEEKPVELIVLNSEGEKTLTLTPTFREANGIKYLSLGVQSGISFLSIMIDQEGKGFVTSITKGYARTVDGLIKTYDGFMKLITGEVSLKHVGGPLAIGQVASDSFNISLSMFFRLMALISINLGLINLFPIPVLDGGHIVFIFLEILNRGPLSRKKLQYAQQLGMSLLFLLIFVAIFNDVSRLFQ